MKHFKGSLQVTNPVQQGLAKNTQFTIKNMLGLLGVSLVVGYTADQNSSDTMPNILWINLDDARADVLGYFRCGKTSLTVLRTLHGGRGQNHFTRRSMAAI